MSQYQTNTSARHSRSALCTQTSRYNQVWGEDDSVTCAVYKLQSLSRWSLVNSTDSFAESFEKITFEIKLKRNKRRMQ